MDCFCGGIKNKLCFFCSGTGELQNTFFGWYQHFLNRRNNLNYNIQRKYLQEKDEFIKYRKDFYSLNPSFFKNIKVKLFEKIGSKETLEIINVHEKSIDQLPNVDYAIGTLFNEIIAELYLYFGTGILKSKAIVTFQFKDIILKNGISNIENVIKKNKIDNELLFDSVHDLLLYMDSIFIYNRNLFNKSSDAQSSWA